MNKFVLILILVCASMFLGCSGGSSNSSSNSVTTAANEAKPIPPVTAVWKKDVTEKDIAGLKWLAGTWKGTAEGKEPFFEKYSIDNNSLTVESYADASLKTVTDTTRYALINGEFRYTTADGRRVAASEITGDRIQFVPVVGEGNSFRFEKQPGGKWRAVLEWPATADKPAKQVIYNMEPYKK